ncbi:putative integrase [Vibrio diazotrophicus]|jgi:hypothetical protein|uniref:Putative integrase n=1 Tax=Vibrio diazotrophicus TaxID=685 RepID=A0A329EFR0_VIBDI|nr:VPA1269 family protein [Vibrio diazotrophicus]RAS63436.1 putative integrase [Vibrio diazotrophicus]
MIVVERSNASFMDMSNGYMSNNPVTYNASNDEIVLLTSISLDKLLQDIDESYGEDLLKVAHTQVTFLHPCYLNLRSLGATSVAQLVQFAVDLIEESNTESTKLSPDLRSIKPLIIKGKISSELSDFKKRYLYGLLTTLKPRFSFKNQEFDFGDEASIDHCIVKHYLTSNQIAPTFVKHLYKLVSFFQQFLLYCVVEKIIAVPAYSTVTYLGNNAYAHIKSLKPQLDLFSELNFASDAFERKSMEKTQRAVMQLYAASTIESVADIPYDALIDINKRRYSDKNYNTSTGSFTKHLANLVKTLERNNYFPNGQVKFDETKAMVRTAKLVAENENNRDNASLNFAKGKINEALRISMSSVLQNYTGTNVTRVALFVDYLIYLEKKMHGVHFLSEMTHLHFYDHTNQLGVKSLKDFIAKKRPTTSQSTLKLTWSTIRQFYIEVLSDEDVIRNTISNRNMPSGDTIYPTDKDKSGVTTRHAMPTYIHEMCIEILTRNNYEFARSAMPQKVVKKQFNYKTKKDDELVFHPNIAHALHLLLIVPLRTHQAVWLDEGLLDEKVFDFATQTFIVNKHPLQRQAYSIRYSDNRTHAERFPCQGVVQQDATVIGEIGLHINTSKTKLITLQKKGETGYQIPWVLNSGIAHLDEVLKIFQRQKEFNDKYSPPDLIPVNTMDRHRKTYTVETYNKLPLGTPLFRDLTNNTVSAFNPNKTNIYLPIRTDLVRQLFYKLLDAVDEEYKARYQTANSMIKDAEGELIYDLHGLRVFGITDLLSKGVDPSIVKTLVGHATEIMTIYYKKLSNQQFRQILADAKRNAGQAPKDIRSYIEGKYGAEVIALFDLIPEWSGFTEARPNFAQGGRNTRMKGGICSQFDCSDGGIEINIIKNKEVSKIGALKGGAMSCGNCRYWRSSSVLLSDQIYFINFLGEEINELTQQRTKLVVKAKELLNDDAIEEDAKLLAHENLMKKSDNLAETSLYKIMEFKNRKKMLEACIDKLKNSVGTLPALKNDFEMPTEMTEFDKCFEMLTQALSIGVDSSETIHLKKAEKFINKLYNVAGTRNPFLYEVDDDTKQLAIVSKLFDTKQMLGDVNDELFDNPTLIFNTYGKQALKNLAVMLSSELLPALEEQQNA